jgi:hypothetical protein
MMYVTFLAWNPFRMDTESISEPLSGPDTPCMFTFVRHEKKVWKNLQWIWMVSNLRPMGQKSPIPIPHGMAHEFQRSMCSYRCFFGLYCPHFNATEKLQDSYLVTDWYYCIF